MTIYVIIVLGDNMKKKQLFVYRDNLLHFHHTLTIDPSTDDLLFKSHSHNMIEIYYFLRGNAHFSVEGNIYKLERGNVIVMASGQTHNLLLDPSPVYERTVLNIDSAAVPEAFDIIRDKVFGGNNFFKLEKSEQLWFEESLNQIKRANEDMLEGLIYAFATMVFSLLGTKISDRAFTAPIQEETVKKTIQFINKNLTKKLSLDIIANSLYCNKAVLNRKFRKIMGCNVWEYVVRKRIYTARQILFNTLDINKAFEKSGFNDYSSFFKAYKKLIGASPSEDLKKINK